MRKSTPLRADWVADAPPYDHHLTAATPLYALAGDFGKLTPLAMHSHEALEFGLVLTGEEEMRFFDSTIVCGPGDVWMCAMWEPHAWRITGRGMNGVVIIFRPEFVHELLGDLSWLTMFAVPSAQRPRTASAEMRETMLALGAMMRPEIENQRQGWQALVRLGLAYLLTALKRDWRPPILSSQQPGAEIAPLTRVMPAVALVNARPSHRVTRADAAAACSLSLSRFCVLFKSAMGMGFEQFCRRTRLAFTAHLLLTTDMPIEAIARGADFADASHLHRLFVKHYKSTPSEYRRTRGTSLSGVAFARSPGDRA